MSEDKGRDLDKQLEQVKEDLKALGSSLQGLTNESLLDLNDAAKSFFNDDFKDMWNSTWKEWNNAWNSTWKEEFNENYRDSWKDKLLEMHDKFHNEDKWKFPSFYGQNDDVVLKDNDIGGIVPWLGRGNRSFRDSYKYSLFSAFGLVSKGTPSVRKYNDCLDKNGQQVYDINGYWRCLFPSSEISNKLLNYKKEHYPNEVLTKEDFVNEVQAHNVDLNSNKYDLGDKGIFFKQFEDLMNWKSVMYKNMKDERRRLRDQKRQELVKASNAEDTVAKTDSETSNPDKKVVSTSVERTYFYSDGKSDYKEVKVEYYDDGTSSVKTTTKQNPENVENHDGVSDQSKGWFWK